ncbi:MAG: protein tyrosine phosphatase family protein [Pseudomonadota bacterium]
MSKLSFARTLWGFAGTLIAKRLGLKRGRADIESVFNYVKIDERLSTSGQPTQEQFAAIRDEGFETVVNLLPQDHENSLKNEPEIVRRLGLNYVYIPVVFTAPTEENYVQFVTAMNEHSGDKVWVHCAVNARVSAFLARYREEVLGESREIARAQIGQIWEPYGVWVDFLDGPDRP